MNRLDIINALIRAVNASAYLEIGVADGWTFSQVQCEHKVGVDINPGSLVATHHQSSDDFFLENTSKFDVVFIDGLHQCDQVQRDIINSLAVLHEDGCIVCHDMNPLTEQMQVVPMITPEWTGDCWKAWVELRSTRFDLDMYVIDTDYGCGIIQKGTQSRIQLDTEELAWDRFCRNRKDWLNLIPPESFAKRLNAISVTKRK